MIGQTISHYTILEKLGEGGMGVVYKAQDTKLDRFVALKFLPAHLKASAQDKSRFTQEAKAAAALNHPNVCSIIDIQEHDGQMFIVMEFVDGQTLRDKARGMSFRQAVDTGIQIADGLAAAHEKGIVHRDIKPENIMIRKDGIAQIMDFGLAKLRASGSAITRLTREGSTVGTAGYMSPEQVQGQDADHRSDIFSYGVLLYELLTGQLPFRGAHETALMYEIVNVDPLPMSSIKPEIDPELDAIVLECLAKEPSERSQSIAEVAKDLRRYKRESTRQHRTRAFPAQSSIRQSQTAVLPTGELVAASKGIHKFIPWVLAGLFALAAIYLGYRQFLAPVEHKAGILASIVLPESIYVHSYGQAAGPPAISPDGRAILFLGVTPDGVPQIYVRSLNTNSVRVLDGTQFAQYPFWSSDGKYIAFFAGGKIRKVDASGGSPISICDAVNPRGGTWTSSGMILFAPDFQSSIFRVPADGGTPVPVTRVDTARNESSHRWPCALPDGKHFLYFARNSSSAGEAEGHAVFVGSVDGSESRLLIHATSNAIYANGYLLYVRASTLVAQHFDLSSLTLQGDPIPIAEDIIDDPGFNLSVISASSTGILLYQQGHARAGAKISLYDRAGKLVSTLGESIEHFRARYSIDGRYVYASIFDPKLFRLNVWRYDLHTGARNRLTSGTGEDYPLPAPDGNSIVFREERGSSWNMFQKPLSGSGRELPLRLVPGQDTPCDWSRDGSTIVFSHLDPGKTRADLWLMQMNGTHEAHPILNSGFDEEAARFSPDGKWIAYWSDESGQPEIYLKAAGGAEGPSWKISSDGGTAVRWAGSSTEVCYVSRQNMMTLVTLRLANNAVEVVSTRPLFSVPRFLESYDISPDGKTFAISPWLEVQKSAPLSVLLNWNEELQQK